MKNNSVTEIKYKKCGTKKDKLSTKLTTKVLKILKLILRGFFFINNLMYLYIFFKL